MWNYHKHEEEYDRPDGSSRELEDNLRVGDVHEARTRVYNAFYINSLESLNLGVHLREFKKVTKASSKIFFFEIIRTFLEKNSVQKQIPFRQN